MLISRGTQIFKTARLLNTKNQIATNLNQTRNTWVYRGDVSAPSWKIAILSECAGGVMYWWILWNLWHGWEGLVKGHIVMPEPDHFTDEELGIPPED